MYFYLHIPFCRQKCPYCKFALTPFVDSFKMAKYVSFLRGEIAEFFKNEWDGSKIESIYFWGGTPSVLSVEMLSGILSEFPKDRFSKEIEITAEANPDDVSKDWAINVAALWVNRVSLGVQTLNDEALKLVSRTPSDTVFRALENLTKAGIASINVDFILGLPAVKSGETISNVKRLHTEFPNITHTSVYFLEKGLYPKEWKGLVSEESSDTDEFLKIREFLVAERGFHHYEVSNFAKPGFESHHNRAYWTHGNVRGFWLSAASYMDGKRFENNHSFTGYYRGEKVHEEVLNQESKDLESFMFGLRTFSLDEKLVPNKTALERFTSEWLLVLKDGKISPTPTWIFVLDHIMSGLL